MPPYDPAQINGYHRSLHVVGCKISAYTPIVLERKSTHGRPIKLSLNKPNAIHAMPVSLRAPCKNVFPGETQTRRYRAVEGPEGSRARCTYAACCANYAPMTTSASITIEETTKETRNIK